jgi:hypothetical protein
MGPQAPIDASRAPDQPGTQGVEPRTLTTQAFPPGHASGISICARPDLRIPVARYRKLRNNRKALMPMEMPMRYLIGACCLMFAVLRCDPGHAIMIIDCSKIAKASERATCIINSRVEQTKSTTKSAVTHPKKKRDYLGRVDG